MEGAKAPTGAEIADALCEELLTPAFFQEHFEKKPLHFRAAERGKSANRLPDALLVDDVADIIEGAGKSLKVFKHGEPSRLGTPWLSYLDGSSMIVNQADRHNQVIFDMCRGLAHRHFEHVFAVVYLTPPASQAVRLHNDDQDVFLLQVWGSKKWTVRNAPQLLPYTEEMLGKEYPVPEELIGAPTLQFTMEPYDVFYIPRGFLHEAATGSQEPSLHVTITVPTSDFCWGVQLVKHLGSQMRNPQLPPQVRGFTQASLAGPLALDDAALDEKLQDLLGAWRKELSAAAVLKHFDERMGKTNDGQARQFELNRGGPSKRSADRVTERSRVRLMHGVTCKCSEGGDAAIFTRATDGMTMDMEITKTAAPLIRALTAAPQWVRDLPGEDGFARLCVLQMLLEQGVVQMFLKAPDDAGSPDQLS